MLRIIAFNISKKYILFLLLFVVFNARAQTDHWETVVFPDDEWHYFVGTSEPPGNWKIPDFISAIWKKGKGGFGFGDGDDGTVVSKARVIYSRINFTVEDLDNISAGVVHADYDDGIIVYINGREVGRSGVVGSSPNHTYLASTSHEAQMYQGKRPEMFAVTATQLKEYLVSGTNTIAVQVHNVSDGSSDMSSNVYFSLGIKNASTLYRETPTWFYAPEVISSNLPLIVIETEEQINKNSKITGHMCIINHSDGSLNKITDKATDYDGYIGIKIRGNVSSVYPQKPYNIETRDALGENNNVSLFGMPKENDWSLINNYKDVTFVKHSLGYHISRGMGQWAARTAHCEVVVNEQRQGIYVFCESIKVDDERVNIAKLKPDELEEPHSTGGFIFKVDYYDSTNADESWIAWYRPPHNTKPVHFVYKYPDWDELMPIQKAYLSDYVEEFERVLYGDNFKDPVDGYRAYIDVPSFINYLIVQEVGQNNDGYKKSCHFFKDRNRNNIRSLLHAGPVWDMDWGFRDQANTNDPSRGFLTGLEYERTLQVLWPTPVTWMVRLMEDPQFANEVYTTYHYYRATVLKDQNLHHYIDSVESMLGPALDTHFDLWHSNLGSKESYYTNEKIRLELWLSKRLAWLDNNLPGELIPFDNFVKAPVTYIHPELNTGENGIMLSHSLKTYPNPCVDKLYVQASKPIENVTVYDMNGKMKMIVVTIDGMNAELNLNNVQPGVYLFDLTLVDGNHLSRKFLVRP